MCIVLDTNVWCCIFKCDSLRHNDYRPVLNWITSGPGFIVYGGSRYKTELKKAPRYLALFLELRKKSKVRVVDHTLVDKEQEQLERLINCPSCDDAHLIAIFRVSGCRLLCSNDKRADVFIKDRHLYPSPQKPPSIYREKKHRRLLCSRNIVAIKNEIR